ncbi:MliC family protein [Sphingobacterium yanglingense]|uniref:Membrane-bound lysozyme inhibitor of c-type lysozyme MliC n=1 Tax=Sphingobacterium yanglingense TaxID=1437280 RepID=A0A4R6WNV2_9SPHI|nr:MliC family protein [Sphingobacterium yanglingense]TDQ80075.1 membrane-bound lysozyme inhibitor of c-type lysozyme MliC [Sphingobacterium yanglingense]
MDRRYCSILLMGAIIGTTACQSNNKQASDNQSTSIEHTVGADEANIVLDSLKDDKGNILNMKFDNAAGTATFVFHKDTILLTQDTTASGVQYSNENYTFTEHQAEAILTKNGTVVFFKSK